MLAHLFDERSATYVKAIGSAGDHRVGIFQRLLYETFFQTGQIVFQIYAIDRQEDFSRLRGTRPTR